MSGSDRGAGSLAEAPASHATRRGIWRLGVAMARRDPPAIDAALAALKTGHPAAAVEEAILQTLLFLGFPAALTTLGRWRRLTGTDASGLTDAEAPPRAEGEAVCEAVYGRAYPMLRRRMATLHPAANRWMVEDGYGKVMGRPGLDLATRELLNVVLLAATDFPEQLHSHLRGALLTGATPEEVEGALEEATAHLPDARREALAARWREVRARLGDEALSGDLSEF
ncbi:MAG: carboxymuconolactone decarboxylase family protein [Deltaproteobacteria bacterium]|nr:carboxymuconolactone decarboxylase family protein [Deltaproteobacteria bacterium]